MEVRRLRVVHVVRQFAPAIGGLEKVVEALVQEQRRMGVDARVLTLNRQFHGVDIPLPEREVIDGIPVQRIPYRGSHRYPVAPDVVKHLKGADLVHIHAVDFFVDYLALLKPLHGHRLVLSTHGGYFHTEFASRLKRVFFHTVTRLSFKALSRVYAISVGDQTIFERICAPDQLKLVENGVDIEKYAGAADESPTRRLVFIGRFSDNKRLDRLVEVFALLTALAPEYQLNIIGKDWDNNFAKLTAQIERLGLSESVTLQTNLTDAAIRERLRDASFVISASEFEGFGQVLVEGMSAGLLPIGSNIASFERQLDVLGMGLLVDFDNRHAAALAIHDYVSEILQDYPAQRQAAMAAVARYGFRQVAEAYVTDYLALCGPRDKQIQGVQVHCSTGEEVVSRIDEAHERGQDLKVAFANTHTINIARSDEQYRDTLNNFLVLNDGVGLDIASKIKYGECFKENLNGTDFVPYYLQQSRRRLKVYLLGAEPQSVAACFEAWRTQYPQHQWLGWHHGYVNGEAEQRALCDEIRRLGADTVIVAMGNPLQEKWIEKYLADSGATVGLGVGALFDFVSGKVKRAPVWLRRLRGEWIYRLIFEPRRLWKRYLVGNLSFLIGAWSDH